METLVNSERATKTSRRLLRHRGEHRRFAMPSQFSRRIGIVLLVLGLVVALPATSTADEVLDWNGVLQRAIATAATPGPLQGRVAAMVHVSMFDAPDAVYPVMVDGPIVGGHAYTLNGVNTKTRLIRAKNSWGREWGNGGFFYLRFADFERLLMEWGEACCAVEATDTDV